LAPDSKAEVGDLAFKNLRFRERREIVELATAAYLPAFPSENCLKVKAKIQREFLIGGITERTGRRHFKALMFGVYGKDQLLSGNWWHDTPSRTGCMKSDFAGATRGTNHQFLGQGANPQVFVMAS
jgi:hypothetical protein